MIFFVAMTFSAVESRNKTRPAKVVVVANLKQKVVSIAQNLVKYAPIIDMSSTFY